MLLLEQVHQTTILAIDDLDRALQRRFIVERDVAGDIDAEFLRRLDRVKHVGRLQHRLGRDATAMQAGTAEFDLFDDRDVQPELLRANRGDIATGSAAE